MSRARIWTGLLVIVVVALLAYWFVSERADPSDVGQAGSATPDVAQPASAGVPVSEAALAQTTNDGTSTAGARVEPELPPILRGTGLSPYRIGDDGTFAIPARHQFAGVSRVYTAESFDAWMAHYSGADQVIIRAFNERNHGVYRNRTPQEIAWMAAHGYPMPEDLVAAQGMTTARLQQLARGGSTKAAFLLQNRVFKEISDKLAMPGYEYLGQVLSDYPQLTDAMEMADDIVKESSSPYKAYLSAREAAVKTEKPLSRDMVVLASLHWAGVLGDAGAGDKIQRFVNSDPARERLRRRLSGVALVLATYFQDTLRKVRSSGCAGVLEGHEGFNPTGLPEL